jgi:predicted transcriptional regulator
MSRKQDPAIRQFILENVETYPGSITSVAAEKFGMTRTGIARYINRLVADELITTKGRTRARRYELKLPNYQ